MWRSSLCNANLRCPDTGVTFDIEDSWKQQYSGSGTRSEALPALAEQDNQQAPVQV